MTQWGDPMREPGQSPDGPEPAGQGIGEPDLSWGAADYLRTTTEQSDLYQGC